VREHTVAALNRLSAVQQLLLTACASKPDVMTVSHKKRASTTHQRPLAGAEEGSETATLNEAIADPVAYVLVIWMHKHYRNSNRTRCNPLQLSKFEPKPRVLHRAQKQANRDALAAYLAFLACLLAWCMLAELCACHSSNTTAHSDSLPPPPVHGPNAMLTAAWSG
jgi:hypothetical protein